MEYVYPSFVGSSKTITMLVGDKTYYATISSSMKEGDDIYNALRSALFAKIGPGLNIVVWHPTLPHKVRLEYGDLKEGFEYRIETTLEPRQQGPGVQTAGQYQKTQAHLQAIMGHWKLDDAAQIFPNHIAPFDKDGLTAPHLWPARFAHEVRKLSGRSVGRWEVAMQYLAAEVQARREQEERPWHVSSADCRAAVTKMQIGTADAAYAELPEEKADTQLFAGGLAEAAQQALEETEGEGANVGSEYEQHGRFNIGSHFR